MLRNNNNIIFKNLFSTIMFFKEQGNYIQTLPEQLESPLSNFLNYFFMTLIIMVPSGQDENTGCCYRPRFTSYWSYLGVCLSCWLSWWQGSSLLTTGSSGWQCERGGGGYGDVMTWAVFTHCWPFVRGIHRSAVDSLHKEPVIWKELLLCDD